MTNRPRLIAPGATVVFRNASAGRRHKVISSSDLQALILFAIYRFASRWNRPALLSRLVERLPIKRLRSEGNRRAQGLLAFFGAAKAPEIPQMCAKYRAGFARHALIYAAERDGRLPDLKISLEDGARLDTALAAGRGALVWTDDFLLETFLSKRALKENGRAINQVTAVGHGYALSRMGRVLINAWQIEVEERYIARWLRFDPAAGDDVRPRIEACLRDNRIVVIANTSLNGHRLIEMDIGEDAVHRIPVGPLDMALRLGTPLLPSATIEDEPLRRYRFIIGEDLRPERCRQGPVQVTDDARAEMVENYRNWLEPLISAYPEQWVPAPLLRRRVKPAAGIDAGR